MMEMRGSQGYAPRGSNFTRKSLTSVRRKLKRSGAWFRELSTVERGIIDLTTRCVETVRSPQLTRVLANILAKVSDFLRSIFIDRMWRIGVPLAREISDRAMSWGNLEAFTWAEDPGFIRYLTVNKLCERTLWKHL